MYWQNSIMKFIGIYCVRNSKGFQGCVRSRQSDPFLIFLKMSQPKATCKEEGRQIWFYSLMYYYVQRGRLLDRLSDVNLVYYTCIKAALKASQQGNGWDEILRRPESECKSRLKI